MYEIILKQNRQMFNNTLSKSPKRETCNPSQTKSPTIFCNKRMKLKRQERKLNKKNKNKNKSQQEQ